MNTVAVVCILAYMIMFFQCCICYPGLVRKDFPKIIITLVDIEQSEIHIVMRFEVPEEMQKTEMQKKICRGKNK